VEQFRSEKKNFQLKEAWGREESNCSKVVSGQIKTISLCKGRENLISNLGRSREKSRTGNRRMTMCLKLEIT